MQVKLEEQIYVSKLINSKVPIKDIYYYSVNGDFNSKFADHVFFDNQHYFLLEVNPTPNVIFYLWNNEEFVLSNFGHHPNVSDQVTILKTINNPETIALKYSRWFKFDFDFGEIIEDKEIDDFRPENGLSPIVFDKDYFLI